MKCRGIDKIKKFIPLIIIGLIVLEYLLGMINQFMAPTIISEDLTMIKQEISFNPLVAFPKAFALPIGMWVNLFLLIAGGIAAVFWLFKEDNDKMWDDRGFWVSKKGQYGTAHWMTDAERDSCLETKNISETQGNILGYISKNKTIIDTDASLERTFDFTSQSKEEINKNVVSIPTKTRLGPHMAVFGASGSGKSYSFSRPLIYQCADRGESMVITDPKGELYNDCAVFLKRMGYDVKQFNLKTPIKSDAWNCLQECVSQGEDNVQLLVQQFTGIIIDNTTPPGNVGGGDSAFFDAAEGSLLTALALYSLLDEYGSLRKENSSMCIGDVYNILTDRNGMEAKFDRLRKINPHHPALKAYGGYISGSDNVKGNIITGLANRLQVMQADVIHEITGNSEIDLTGPGKRKTAIFVIISDQEATLKFLASLFFTFLFVRLVDYADSRPNGKCDVPVNMIMDEFPNIGVIPDFTKKISTVRSRDLRLIIIFQNLAQLEERYPNNASEEILGNCDTQICLGVRDQKTAEYLSKKCGELTTYQTTDSIRRNKLTGMTETAAITTGEGYGHRNLMNPDEIQKLNSNKLIAFIAGKQPLCIDKYGYVNHPDAEYSQQCSFMAHEPEWYPKFLKKKEDLAKQIQLNKQSNRSV